jgi:hypothetical protein
VTMDRPRKEQQGEGRFFVGLCPLASAAEVVLARELEIEGLMLLRLVVSSAHSSEVGPVLSCGMAEVLEAGGTIQQKRSCDAFLALLSSPPKR